MNAGDGCTMRMYIMPQNDTLKMVKMVKFTLYMFTTILKMLCIHRTPLPKVRVIKSFDHKDFCKQRQSSGIMFPVVMIFLHLFICLFSYSEGERG